jgi:y4mF family transcriptional regulator
MIMLIDKKTQKLGELIRAKRKEQDLTQEQLAGISGVGVRFIRELEHGKESCHLGKALLVTHMLGLEILVDGDKL